MALTNTKHRPRDYAVYDFAQTRDDMREIIESNWRTVFASRRTIADAQEVIARANEVLGRRLSDRRSIDR
jgi:hypothetical protein